MPFCKMPWLSMKVDVEGNIRPCCNFRGTLGQFHQPEDLRRYQESAELANLKARMLNKESMPECATCLIEENQGLFTDRLYSLQRCQELPLQIEEMDLSLTNNCNMVCVMCTPRFSSKWESVEKEILGEVEWAKPSFYSGRRYSMTVENIDALAPMLQRIKWLKLIGGEPFACPAITRLLEIWRDFTHERRLTVITNVSLIKEEHMQIMREIPGMDVSCSVDGTGDIFAWIRGYSWPEVESKMLRMRELGIPLGLGPTIQLANAFNVIDLYRWGIRHDIPVRLNHFLSAPEYLAVRVLPHELWNEIAQNLAAVHAEERAIYEGYLRTNDSGFGEWQAKAAGWIAQFDKRRSKPLREIDSRFSVFLAD